VPMGGYARVIGEVVEFTGLVASVDGLVLLRRAGTAPVAEAAELGRRIALEILAAGGKAILDEVYCQPSIAEVSHP
jgi:hydroxymethylbilane synthase